MAAAWKYPFSSSKRSDVDLSSYDAFHEGAPFATFARMRREEPVAWSPERDGRGFWSVTRHADINKLNRDPALMSSARGIRIEDQTEDEFEARKTFQETDPPLHTKFRLLVNEAFSRPQIVRYEDQIRSIAAGLIDEALESGEVDAVERIARQLPMRMLGQIIRLPDSDMNWLVEKGDALISNTDPEFTQHVLDLSDTNAYRLLPFRSPAALELAEYATEILGRIRRGEDVGVLNQVAASMGGDYGMTPEEFRNFFCLLVAAGNDTTRYCIAASLHALANQGDLLDTLRQADQKAMQAATDEMIRWASPTTHFRRTATEDFELHGVQIRAGDKVVLWFISGNRDEAAFDAPDTIVLSRSPNRHLSFGQGGPHVCLGMWLAKLEVRVVLEEIARRVASLEQTGPHAFMRSNFILGIKRLPLQLKAR